MSSGDKSRSGAAVVASATASPASRIGVKADSGIAITKEQEAVAKLQSMFSKRESRILEGEAEYVQKAIEAYMSEVLGVSDYEAFMTYSGQLAFLLGQAGLPVGNTRSSTVSFLKDIFTGMLASAPILFTEDMNVRDVATMKIQQLIAGSKVPTGKAWAKGDAFLPLNDHLEGLKEKSFTFPSPKYDDTKRRFDFMDLEMIPCKAFHITEKDKLKLPLLRFILAFAQGVEATSGATYTLTQTLGGTRGIKAKKAYTAADGTKVPEVKEVPATEGSTYTYAKSSRTILTMRAFLNMAYYQGRCSLHQSGQRQPLASGAAKSMSGLTKDSMPTDLRKVYSAQTYFPGAALSSIPILISNFRLTMFEGTQICLRDYPAVTRIARIKQVFKRLSEAEQDKIRAPIGGLMGLKGGLKLLSQASGSLDNLKSWASGNPTPDALAALVSADKSS